MTALDAAQDLLWGWMPLWKPSARATVADWAEANIMLPPESNADAGPLVLTGYQHQALDLVADPSTRIAVFQWASQTGKSTILDTYLAYSMAADPGPILLVQPTDGKAKDYVIGRLDPLIRATKALRSIVGGGRKGLGDSTTRKLFPGGSFNVASSHKPDDLAARSIRTLLLDEIDRFSLSAGAEGDPVALAIRRTHRYRLQSKILIASTPTTKESRIAKWLDRGTLHRFFVTCPDCGASDHLRFENLHWSPGRPDTAHLSCTTCGVMHGEAARLKMIDGGRFVATQVGEPGIVSLHLNILASKFATLAEIAQDAENADKNPEAKRVFINTSLAEPYDFEEQEAIDPNELQARAVTLRSPYPAGMLFVSCGVDVQADRLELTFVGHGKAGQAFVLNHLVLRGDTTGPTPWAALAQTLGSTFTTKDGRVLPVEITAVDSGNDTSNVSNRVLDLRNLGLRVEPIKGKGGWDRPIITQGPRIGGIVRPMIIGTDPAKRNLYARLRMTERGPGSIFISNHLPLEYFEGLGAEVLTTHYVRGFPRQAWDKIVARNEPLDCLVYALAVATLIQQPSAVPEPTYAQLGARLHQTSNGAQ